MRLFISIGLGAAIGVLLFSVVTQSKYLFTFDEMMTATTRYTATARNATSGGTWPLSVAQLPNKTSDRNSETSAFTPPACTAEQLEMTVQRHPGSKAGGGCHRLYSTTFLTCCPQATWLEEYYTSQRQLNSKKQKSFLAINVGCNKGYDAVNLLRMGSNNPAVNRQTWKDAMPPDLKVAVCNQDKESTMTLVSDPSLSHGDKEDTIALVYCVEPMPSTYGALLNASRATGWDNQLKVLQIAMNNEDPTTVLFPGPVSENLGAEGIGIMNSCSATPEQCVPVESLRLDAMMTKENFVDKRLNILLIDVEGYDFDVILGGNTTLRNTEYIEFEYHNVGKWGKESEMGKQPIKIAVEHLDDIGFTCYWAGKGELWRITGCWQPQFRGAYWSNVACANRQLAPSLLRIMESTFQKTVSTTLHPKSPIDAFEFLEHNASRYDTVVLYDADENERYELTVVDRNRTGDFQRPTCVWLDPPSERISDRRGELQAAAERMGCIRIIAVDQKPQGPALFSACTNENSDIVRELLKHDKVDVNCMNSHGLTALISACTDENLEIVRELLKHDKVDVNCMNSHGLTALFSACTNENLDIVRELLIHDKVDVNRRDRYGNTALILASRQGQLCMVRELLKHDKLDVNVRDNEGCTSLMAALSRRVNWSTARELLKHDDMNVNVQDGRGDTALTILVYRCKNVDTLDMMRLLLKQDGVNVNCQNDRGFTALMIASSLGYLEATRELLKLQTVDVNCQDIHGRTALIRACSAFNLDVIRALLEHNKVDVNCQDNNGNTALILACVEYCYRSAFVTSGFDMIRVLLRKESLNVNCQNELGETAVTIAISNDSLGLLNELLKLESLDENCQDKYGSTVLTWACSTGNLDVLRVLLKRDELDVNAKDQKGRTAFYLASSKYHWDVIDVLLEYEPVDVNAKGSLGNTTLIWACIRGRLDIVCKLLEDGRVDMSIRNKAGSTALDVARNLDLIEIAACLEEHDKSCLRRKWNPTITDGGVELERTKKKSRREYYLVA
ncbi:methyltransferase [Fragilaria crotonensis]|nr:methyltransferase [Fragilaria crotonensis]